MFVNILHSLLLYAQKLPPVINKLFNLILSYLIPFGLLTSFLFTFGMSQDLQTGNQHWASTNITCRCTCEKDVSPRPRFSSTIQTAPVCENISVQMTVGLSDSDRSVVISFHWVLSLSVIFNINVDHSQPIYKTKLLSWKDKFASFRTCGTQLLKDPIAR